MKRFLVIVCGSILLVCLFFVAYFWILLKPWYSGFNAEVLLEKYSDEEIYHFASFAFQDGRLKKWKDDIRIGLEYESGLDSAVLISTQSCIETLKPLLGGLNISIEDSDHNVVIQTVDTMEGQYVRGTTYHSFKPFTIPYPTIGYSMVVVRYDQGNNSMHSRIHYELGHVLGFYQNWDEFKKSNYTDYSWFNPPTIFLPDSTEVFIEHLNNYSALDKAAIRIMYDPEVAIDPGLTKEKFYRLIEEGR